MISNVPDIGDIRVPEAILRKPGPLTAEERALVAQHPVWGAELLETVPLLTPALVERTSRRRMRSGSGRVSERYVTEQCPLSVWIRHKAPSSSDDDEIVLLVHCAMASAVA